MTTVDRTHLLYLDRVLNEIQLCDSRFAQHRTRDKTFIRSAAIEVVMHSFLDGDDSVRDQAKPSPDIGDFMTDDVTNILLAGVVQRMELAGRQRLETLELVLPPSLMRDLDKKLRRFALRYLDEVDQPFYLGDGYGDLRSALIEAVMLGWMIDSGFVARHAVPACETTGRLEAQERAARRRRWLRLLPWRA